tara:strand:- start:452 stop:616 length:165 start_codon:yes stop_codon:yes gene_type:complete
MMNLRKEFIFGNVNNVGIFGKTLLLSQSVYLVGDGSIHRRFATLNGVLFGFYPF